MSNPVTNRIISEIAGKIDIPDSVYEKAERKIWENGSAEERPIAFYSIPTSTHKVRSVSGP